PARHRDPLRRDQLRLDHPITASLKTAETSVSAVFLCSFFTGKEGTKKKDARERKTLICGKTDFS
ncbi:MAG: hypothetical protein IJF24_02595, partial [Clostridia bacterium]|nr:hypothetical protein [Clostridia bacterium]